MAKTKTKKPIARSDQAKVFRLLQVRKGIEDGDIIQRCSVQAGCDVYHYVEHGDRKVLLRADCNCTVKSDIFGKQDATPSTSQP